MKNKLTHYLTIITCMYRSTFLLSQINTDTLFSKSLGYIHYGHISNIEFYSNNKFHAKSMEPNSNNILEEHRGNWCIQNDTVKLDSMHSFLFYYYPNGFALTNIIKENKLDTIGTFIASRMNGCTVSYGETIYLLSNNIALSYYSYTQTGTITDQKHKIGQWTWSLNKDIELKFNNIKSAYVKTTNQYGNSTLYLSKNNTPIYYNIKKNK